MFVDEALLLLPPGEAYLQLRMAIDAEPELPASWYARWWASDTQVLLGDLDQAISEYPPASGWRATLQVERLLSLKTAAGQPYSAADLLALAGPKITAFGRERFDLVLQAATAMTDATSTTERIDLLQRWAVAAPHSPYPVFIGSGASWQAGHQVSLEQYHFAQVPACLTAGQQLARTAENMVREEAGIPGVGQGWVSETRLFVQIRDALPELKVQQHASPPWLGRQHLDVYLPELHVALEYQGLQHDQPVAFFGGEQAFAATQRRDARKRQLCRRHGTRLVYVRAGYDLAEILAQIRS